MGMEYFCCYNSYRKKVAKLSDQEVGRLFRSLMEYNETGEAQELTGRESVAFDFIADDIDRAKKSYQEKCEKNRTNRASANDRQRPSTTVNDRQQYKDKDEDEDKDEDKDEDEDKSIGGMVSPYNPLSTFPPPSVRASFSRWLKAMEAKGKPCEGAELEEMLRRTEEYYARWGEKHTNEALESQTVLGIERLFEPKR